MIEPCDFETAISATGFGKFNIILYVVSIVAVWASFLETTTMSYVVLVAQCELGLTLDSKGLLNAVPYIGMISTGFVWGFVSDTWGRRKLIIVGFLLDGVICIMCSFSRSVLHLMIFKFLGGFIVNGPYSSVMSYLSEFHGAKARAKVQLLVGFSNALGSIFLPLLAYGVLPLKLDNDLIKGLNFHSWNVFILLCSLPTLMSGIVFIFLPESPKYLMTSGRNEESLEVFRTVYSLNTGRPKDTFPVKRLVDESPLSKKSYSIKKMIGETESGNKNMKSTPKSTESENSISLCHAMQNGLKQMKPLLHPPHFIHLILVCFIQFMVMMSANALRLWMPQFFQSVELSKDINDGSENLCSAIETLSLLNTTNNVKCSENFDSSQSYLNSIYVSFPTILTTVLSAIFINKFGKKPLLFILGSVSGCLAYALYFSTNNLLTIGFASLVIGLNTSATHTVIAVVVDLFPTTLRTMAVSLVMIFGRSGVIFGNILFPKLLESGCAAPFFTLGSVMFVWSLVVFTLPNTDMKPLQ